MTHFCFLFSRPRATPLRLNYAQTRRYAHLSPQHQKFQHSPSSPSPMLHSQSKRPKDFVLLLLAVVCAMDILTKLYQHHPAGGSALLALLVWITTALPPFYWPLSHVRLNRSCRYRVYLRLGQRRNWSHLLLHTSVIPTSLQGWQPIKISLPHTWRWHCAACCLCEVEALVGKQGHAICVVEDAHFRIHS